MENLENLIGSKVRIFRGGPESRDGVLLDKQSDFLTLFTEQDGVVYYNLLHIKSVIKNSKDGHISNEDEDNEDLCMKANDFQDLLENLKGSRIRIDRGGPESRDGKLLDVFSDYLVLETEKEGVIYYKTHHIKSVSLMNQKEMNNDEQQAEPCQYVEAMNFQELLNKLKYSWVKINRGGPEKIEGVLVDSSDDYLVLTVNDEVNRIPIFHIRNISVIENELKIKLKKQKDEENEDEATDEEEKHVEANDVSGEDDSQNSSEERNDDDREEENDELLSENDLDQEDEENDEVEATDEVEVDDEGEAAEEDGREKYYNYNPPAPVWFNEKMKLN